MRIIFFFRNEYYTASFGRGNIVARLSLDEYKGTLTSVEKSNGGRIASSRVSTVSLKRAGTLPG